MGYNAEKSDPLYKHWPFFIAFDPDLKRAYGVFYDSFARMEFDMGWCVQNGFLLSCVRAHIRRNEAKLTLFGDFIENGLLTTVIWMHI